MGQRLNGGLGGGVSEVRRRLGAWRAVHGGRGKRLPEELWDAAVGLAASGDPGVVARALRLNPQSLSRRLTDHRGGLHSGRVRRSVFVEVTPAAEPGTGGGCRVEVSSPGGARVAIHLADPGSVDLVTLAAGLLRAGR